MSSGREPPVDPGGTMSDHTAAQPEYLGPDPSAPRRSGGGRRAGIFAAAAVAVLAAMGAGAYGAVQLFAGGSSPASAIPASAIGYVSLDLDPSASQKIEAIKIIRKFPALRKAIRLGSRDDVRRRIFDEIDKEGHCSQLSYQRDVEPWIGDRVALAAVPAAHHRIVPLVALQVRDQDKARAGASRLSSCERSGDPTAVAYVGDYMLLGERQPEVDAMARAATAAPLQDDPGFETWMTRTGDPGILTMYAARNAVDVVLRSQSGWGGRGASGAAAPEDRQLASAFKDFGGAAGVLRFKDGAVEAELQAKGLGPAGGPVGTGRGPDVRSLPASTAAVLSLSFQKGWLNGYVDQLRSTLGAGEVDSALSQAEQQTGLRLPQDIETLLGDGLSVSVDSSTDLHALASSPDPSRVAAGIRIKGDAERIRAVIARLEAAAGASGDIVKVHSRGDTVVVGTDGAYLRTLLQSGDLGSSPSFEAAVPEPTRAGAVLFVSFDAGNGWAQRLADELSDGDPDVKANIAPLDALGVSGWVDKDKVQHSLLRLTTD